MISVYTPNLRDSNALPKLRGTTMFSRMFLLAGLFVGSLSAQQTVPTREWDYARFGVIFKLKCGSSDPYVSGGKWSTHPIKRWQDVNWACTTAPRHGEEVRLGTYDNAKFTSELSRFKKAATAIVGSLAVGHPEFKKAAIEAAKQTRDDKPESYQDIVYDAAFYDEMRARWAGYLQLAQSINLNNPETRLKYAYLGVLVSFSRGLMDRFYLSKPNHTQDLRVSRNFENASLKNWMLRDSNGIAGHIRQFGNLCAHNLTKLGTTVTKDTYEYWMLNLRVKILHTIERLRIGHPIAQSQSPSPQNAQIITFWEDALRQFNTIRDAPVNSKLREFAEDPKRYVGKANRTPESLGLMKTNKDKAESPLTAFKAWKKREKKWKKDGWNTRSWHILKPENNPLASASAAAAKKAPPAPVAGSAASKVGKPAALVALMKKCGIN